MTRRCAPSSRGCAAASAALRTYRLPTREARHLRRRPGRGDPPRRVRAVPRLAPATGGSSASGSIRACSASARCRPGQTRHLEGPSSDTSPQGNITFHRLRDYVAGDDLRLVHWRSSARAGKLVVKHNVDTSQPYSVVLLDLRPGRYTAESFESAVDVAASVLVAGVGEQGAGRAAPDRRHRHRRSAPPRRHTADRSPDRGAARTRRLAAGAADRAAAGARRHLARRRHRCAGPRRPARTSPRCGGGSTGSSSSRSTPSTDEPGARSPGVRVIVGRRRGRGVRGVERAERDRRHESARLVPLVLRAAGPDREP